MRISNLLFNVFGFLLPPALICTVGLYLYPLLFDCSFPPARAGEAGCSIPGSLKDAIPEEVAPFRLLALADPQLEGDTSLPHRNEPALLSLWGLGSQVERDGVKSLPSSLVAAGKELVRHDIPKMLQRYRKRLDLWGNDLYLAHIYRLVSWWADPTHTVVLGDLLGSQHIGEEEFRRRSQRFWNTVFAGSEKVPRSITDVTGRSEVLGQDESWRRRVIAVAGNHDIGYAGDIDEHGIERFEQTFGSVNWEIRFKLDNGTSTATHKTDFSFSPLAIAAPELRVIVLNSMNLDAPAKDTRLQNQSRDFIAHELHRAVGSAPHLSSTVLLTHIPLYKEEGVCVDGPFFDHFPPHKGGGIKEQNHLSKASSDYILNGLASLEKTGKAIILNGHDHEGCDTYHYRSTTSSNLDSSGLETISSPWEAKRLYCSQFEIANDSLIGVREITVRSVMGEFGGNAGLLSAWFDRDVQEWKFEYRSCSLGVQHIWWGVHILAIVVLATGFAGLLAFLWEDMRSQTFDVIQQEGAKLKEE